MAISISPEKSYGEDYKRLRDEIEQKHGKTADQLREEREKRVNDAIELRVPDRVPVTIQTGVFAAKYAGLPLSSMYYDHAAYREACLKTILEFEPDTGASMVLVNSGLVMELLDVRHQAWPGGTLGPDTPYQFVEGEYMKAEEYDLFLDDPSDFIFRYYLPRIYGTLQPLTKLPPFRNMIGGMGFTAILGFLLRPEFKEFAEKLMQAARKQEELRQEGAGFSELMHYLGFPSQYGAGLAGGGIGQAPFDVVSDMLRGMRGAMLDMYRCPDKLLAACDKILEWRIAQAVPAEPDARGYRRRAGMPLHRGSDGFMSLPQFEKFYWPGLKKAILTNIELGYISAPFWEGIWDERLEYLLELPKGRVVFHCEKTDIFKAKEILGDHMCIQGGVPPSLLQYGSPQDVDEHCKKLIEVVGKNGGFILGSGSVIDYAKPENIKAMVDSVKKYGLN
ncbi:MAG: uroporphyrinogen decarboxylase family protein [Dehalococcoidales bacterium]